MKEISLLARNVFICNNCRTIINPDEPLYQFVLKQKIGWWKTPNENNSEKGLYRDKGNLEIWTQCGYCYDQWRIEVTKSNWDKLITNFFGIIFGTVLMIILGSWLFFSLKKNPDNWLASKVVKFLSNKSSHSLDERGVIIETLWFVALSSLLYWLIFWVVKKIFITSRADRCRIRNKIYTNEKTRKNYPCLR